jgi:hypothetical protein
MKGAMADYHYRCVVCRIASPTGSSPTNALALACRAGWLMGVGGHFFCAEHARAVLLIVKDVKPDWINEIALADAPA